MIEEAWVAHRADPRAVSTNSGDPGLLNALVEGWSIPSGLPAGAARRWKRACDQFRSGPLAYENFTEAVRNGFECVDSVLRHANVDLLRDGELLTFGPLIERAHRAGRLDRRQYEWLSSYALHFRNRLTHADLAQPLVLTPPIAADMLAGIARFLTNFMAEGEVSFGHGCRPGGPSIGPS
ncbi:MAG: hypothetical protein JO291_04790 [Acidimicrobiia bacterium]|nr:hypothetical protein [Acidimicrobiia bacterium]